MVIRSRFRILVEAVAVVLAIATVHLVLTRVW